MCPRRPRWLSLAIIGAWSKPFNRIRGASLREWSSPFRATFDAETRRGGARRSRWEPAITHAFFIDFLGKAVPYDVHNSYEIFEPVRYLEPEPDPDDDEHFYPGHHDGWSALKLGIDYWRSECNAYSERVQSGDYDDYDKLTANRCRIALDAFDYLTSVIGIDIDAIFKRWREVPAIFMPPAISNKHASEKGSLNDLLDNAVRAYVCGAPAAAIAMCRSVLEMVVKDHYLTDSKDRSGQTSRAMSVKRGFAI